jgi:hypothetical protein
MAWCRRTGNPGGFQWFMTYKYNIGVYMVLKHIFQGQDWTTFKHFDIAKGWPVTTSPWRVVFSSPVQKVVDRLVNFARWKNPAYDKIVDEVFVTDMSNKPKLMELFRKAMEIWIPESPDIALTYNYHRIPMNTTYWTNWPTEQNPYINGAFWHLTYPIVLWNLQPTQ